MGKGVEALPERATVARLCPLEQSADRRVDLGESELVRSSAGRSSQRFGADAGGTETNDDELDPGPLPLQTHRKLGGHLVPDATKMSACSSPGRLPSSAHGGVVPSARPRLLGVLETVLYYASEQEEEVERFYRDVLGLRPLGRSRWMMALRAGENVYLMCDADQYAKQNDPPLHGASGPVHTCFLAPAEEYERWKKYLPEQGVPLIEEVTREAGSSFYFRDPAGNLLEIAERDMWPP